MSIMINNQYIYAFVQQMSPVKLGANGVFYVNNVGPPARPPDRILGFLEFSLGFHGKAYHCKKFQVSRTPGSGQTIQDDKQTNIAFY